jgi:hypothetical protein
LERIVSFAGYGPEGVVRYTWSSCPLTCMECSLGAGNRQYTGKVYTVQRPLLYSDSTSVFLLQTSYRISPSLFSTKNYQCQFPTPLRPATNLSFASLSEKLPPEQNKPPLKQKEFDPSKTRTYDLCHGTPCRPTTADDASRLSGGCCGSALPLRHGVSIRYAGFVLADGIYTVPFAFGRLQEEGVVLR